MRSLLRVRPFVAAVVGVSMLVAACSGNDDDSSQSSTTTEAPSTTADVDEPAGTTIPEPDPEPVDPTGSGLVCEPFGEPVGEPDAVLNAAIGDFTLTAETAIDAGIAFVLMNNNGDVPHELIIVAAPDGIDGLPTTSEGAIDEDAATVLARIGPVGKGDSCEGTLQLDAGTYVLADNQVVDGVSYFAEGAAQELIVG